MVVPISCAGWAKEVVISLTRVFLNLKGLIFSLSIFSSGTGIGVSSLLWGLSHNLETKEFAEVEEVEGFGVIALVGLHMVSGVAVAVMTTVVGIKVANALDSTRGFSINLTLYCLLFTW